MRGLAAVLVLLALAGACGQPQDAVDDSSTAALPSDDPNAFRADALGDRPYAGEWAQAATSCANPKKIWTVEPLRMGIEQQRFCVFQPVAVADGEQAEDQVWSASARCLAQGRQSKDFVFFRVKPNRHEMRVTINDSTAVDLVRCPSKT